jgi:hypothetical protein
VLPKTSIQRTLDGTQLTFGGTLGTFGGIQETFGGIQGTFDGNKMAHLKASNSRFEH